MTTEILVKHGLKVTPQRLAVLNAMEKLSGHPTADSIIEFIRRNHPNIAVGTVYKTLETFVEKGIFKKVKTEKDYMRYEITTMDHHHLYCSDSERIEDYHDDELNNLLKEYFTRKNIPNFKIEDLNLQITGRFTDKNIKP
jgi:Fur family transcriptional regulator, peroxide stress response regulator